MARLIVLLLLISPRLHGVPDWAKPFWQHVRHEPEIVASYLRHQDEPDVVRSMLSDSYLEPKARQRLWQGWQKARGKR